MYTRFYITSLMGGTTVNRLSGQFAGPRAYVSAHLHFIRGIGTYTFFSYISSSYSTLATKKALASWVWLLLLDCSL